MSWLKNLLSGNKTESKEPEKKEKQKTHDFFSFTVKDLKSWCKEELPPLGWQKLRLMVAKKAKEKCNFCFGEASDDTKIPEELLEIIDSCALELFNKRFLNDNS